MLIIAVILLGMIAGGVARWLVGRVSRVHFSAAEAFAAGLGGSLVGGLLLNLLTGDGFDITVSGLVGSTVGAVLVLGVWAWVRGRSAQR